MLRYYKVLTVLLRLIIAFILYPIAYVFLSHKKYFIIGTRNGVRGHDNAEYFLSYCTRNNISAKVIYNDAHQKDELCKNSIKSILYILCANNVYITHSESDVLDYFWRFIPGIKYIFIQHGVIGIKKLPDYENKTYHRYISSSEYETEIFRNFFHLSNDKIIKSGLPRFDFYDHNRSENDEIKSCLVMFTWRKSDSGKAKLIKKYTEMVTCLANESLNKIYICVHEANLSTFKTLLEQSLELDDRFSFIENDKLSCIIKSTELLITDYSSVAWDYLYQNKYILFYTPDIDDYKNTTGLYCNFSDFFGAHLMNFSEINYPFVAWIMLENKIKNKKFLARYKFYNMHAGIHSEYIVKNS